MGKTLARIDTNGLQMKLKGGNREYRGSTNPQRNYCQRMFFLLLVLVIVLTPLHEGLIDYSQNDTTLNPDLITYDNLDELSNGIIGSGDEFETVIFPIGSFVIPMDDKQNDVLKAFGFTHALLRNGTFIYRIIEPPDIIIETALYPSFEVFAGGPILVMPFDADVVNTVHLQFPSVSLDTTINLLGSDQVDVITRPTDILIIFGVWGHTQDVLADMEIPFTMVNRWEVESDPDMLFDYDLIVDDCPGWYNGDQPSIIPSDIANNMRILVESGGEIIFTDRSLVDMEAVFPGYIGVVTNVDGTWPCLMRRIPEFPGQYYGPSTLDIYTMNGGKIMNNPIDPSVRIMIDSNDYNGEYRILAAYFHYGASIDSPGGIVEGFGYHPGDQPPDARVLASIMFGNKFVHLPPPPDLEVSPSDIVFFPASPVEIGTPVTINATIHNIGIGNASDVLVRFYDGEPGMGIQIGSDQVIPLIERIGGIGYAEINWIAAPAKTHDIYVVVDPMDMIAESNEDNNIASKIFEVIDFLPPLLYIRTVEDDIVLNWSQPMPIGLSHYLLYRATSQTGFNFLDVWMNTLTDINPVTGIIDPLNTIWMDTNVINKSDPNYQGEYYYIARAVNILGVRSTTSNTVGYYAMQFSAGMNTFSLPLQPFDTLSLNAIKDDMGATSISWLNENDVWLTYPSNPSINAQIGSGYVAEFDTETEYVFVGEPASMIMFNEGFGFDDATRDDLIANVDASGNVALSWTPIAGADKYFVLKSNTRDGFHTYNYDIVEVQLPSYQDIGAAIAASEKYYLVVPYNSTQGNGASTYSIGVITSEFSGNEMFGLPLKTAWGTKSADWYVDQIPDCLGIVYLEDGIWKAHFKEFDEGVYDTSIEYSRGYELSVYVQSRYSFIGW